MKNKTLSVNGYTLIELMVMVALLSLVMIAMVSLFLTMLKAGGKASALARIKEEGDYAIQTMERQIRNADSIDTSTFDCVSATTNNLVTSTADITGIGVPTVRTYDLAGMRIRVNDGTDKLLTSTEVVITRLDFTCADGSFFSGPVVRISFDIEDSDLSDVTETFSTTVIMRSSGED